MTKILTITAAVISIVFIAGCNSTNYINQPASPLQVVTKAKLSPNIEVGEKIEATATVNRLFWLFTWGPGKFAEGVNYGSNLPQELISDSSFNSTISEAKAAAAYKACVENKADFIVCPRYYVITHNYFFFRTTTAKVFGYKGVLLGVEKKAPVIPEKTTVKSIELDKPVRIAQPVKVLVEQQKPEAVKQKQVPVKSILPDSSEK